LVDTAAKLVEPAPAPTWQPGVRSMTFLEDLPWKNRVLVGPLFALEPSGLLGAMFLVAPMVIPTLDPALAAMTSEPRDPNLPPGNRLPEVEPTPREETAKLLANEPGLGWIWWGAEVPVEHVSDPVDIQTPAVGRIRIVLKSGDYTEGVLHSIGRDSYWLDGDLGRFSVATGLVDRVERLAKPGLGKEGKSVQAGDLVRVKLLSGYVEGRLISTKGDTVLVETADGMRMTLKSSTIKRLGGSKTRVILP
jgi:hypothetical protein